MAKARIARSEPARSATVSVAERASASDPKARTIEELWSVVADCLSAFTADECRHYFEAAGYDPD